LKELRLYLIINTFISDGEKIPEYTLLSLHRLRELNPDERILFIAKDFDPYGGFFSKNRIEMVHQQEVKSPLLDEFNKLSNLKRHGRPNTKYPSPNFFFHRAMERIYYLEALISKNNFSNVWHFENDVLTYLPLPKIEKTQTVVITPMGRYLSTMAVSYIEYPNYMTHLCNELNDLLAMGEDVLTEVYELDMVNEMTLLGIQILDEFPTLPIMEESKLMYDPGSYGQYLGGTNCHDHGPGYAGNHHYIGESINEGIIKPTMLFGKPYVRKERTGELFPLFNLHIHSKNLKDFL
jgi:hypothetical protein